MKTSSASRQVGLAREYGCKCVNSALAVLLSNVAVALSGRPSSDLLGYALVTAGAAGLYGAAAAAVWLVRVKLKP